MLYSDTVFFVIGASPLPGEAPRPFPGSTWAKRCLKGGKESFVNFFIVFRSVNRKQAPFMEKLAIKPPKEIFAVVTVA